MRDPGLAQERTDLAWQRTSLALLVACALLLRLSGGSPFGATLVALIAGLVLLMSRAGSTPIRLRDGRRGGLLTLGVVVLSVTEMAVIARG